MGESVADLWNRHLSNGDSAARQNLIENYTGLVRKIAGSMYSRRFRDHIEFNEYFQLGVVGLIESVDRFDPDKGATFETFASYRIRGSILNGLEKSSELRSQGSYRQRLLKDRVTLLTKEQSSSDLFDEMVDLTLGLAIGFMLEDTGLFSSQEKSLEDSAYKSGNLQQLREHLLRAVDTLPERESQIIRYHYLQGARFDDVARLLGVSKGRVSQLHKRALQRLRDCLGRKATLDTFL